MGKSNTILEAKGITKKFGSLMAVDDIDLGVSSSEKLAIIGPNGAGKTTFFNMISGTLTPTEGKVVLDGSDVTGKEPYKISRLGLSRSFQTPNISTDLTVEENVQLGIQYQEASSFSPSFYFRNFNHDEDINNKSKEMIDTLGLGHTIGKAAEELTLGEKKKLELSMTLSTDPSVILLDEPTAGLNSQERMSFISGLEATTQNRTVIIIEHNIEVVSDLSDRIIVLHNGKILTEGKIHEIRNDEQVRDVYLGGE